MVHKLLLSGLLLVTLCVGYGMVCPTVQAAEYTEIRDAADEDDPFDFMLGVTFKQEFEMARFSRERNEFYKETSQGEKLNQPEYELWSNRKYVEVDARFGLYHDLEFHVKLPVYTQEDNDLNMEDIWRKWYWTGAPASSYSVPSLMNDGVTGYTSWGATRAGFGDMRFGFVYGIMNEDREPAFPRFNLGFDITVPTGKEKSPVIHSANAGTNPYRGTAQGGAGDGLVVFHLYTALSKKYGAADPYMGFHGDFPVSTGGYIETPANRGGFTLGIEVTAFEMKPSEDSKADVPGDEPLWKIAADFRLGLSAVGRGQEFNALVEGLGWRLDNDDAWGVDPRSNVSSSSVNPISSAHYNYGGEAASFELPTHQPYMEIEALIGWHFKLYHFLQLESSVSVKHRTAHFIAIPDQINASTLRPADQDGYNNQIEETSARVRYERDVIIGYTVGLALTY